MVVSRRRSSNLLIVTRLRRDRQVAGLLFGKFGARTKFKMVIVPGSQLHQPPEGWIMEFAAIVGNSLDNV